MFEKRLAAVAPQSFTANGTTTGVIKVADASLFVVKQCVYLTADTLPNLDRIEVKAVLDATTIVVGPITGNINSVTDISAYTTGLNAAIAANEQKRPSIPLEEFTRAVYAEEPAVAIRTLSVDKLGNPISATNPLPVSIDGEINIDTVNVSLTHLDNDPNPGDVADSVRIGDGTNELSVNNDGSINVNVVSSGTNEEIISEFNAVSAVPSASLTNILSYTVPVATQLRLNHIEFGGSNIATYEVHINTVLNARKRTNFGADLYGDFNYTANDDKGLLLEEGDTVVIKVIHSRSMTGDFEARICGALLS